MRLSGREKSVTTSWPLWYNTPVWQTDRHRPTTSTALNHSTVW